MSQETLGYVKLEWTCANCGTRNPGPQKKCTGCGAPQPENVQFEQAAEEKLITDQAEIARAEAGPDIHCPYCGVRNPGNASKCSQCGGDLAGGNLRASGRVLGAHRSAPAQPVQCPSCGATNPGTALKCSQCGATLIQAQQAPPAESKPARKGLTGLIVGCLLVALLAICAAVGLTRACAPSKELVGQVRATSWTRSVAIEELRPVTREGWRDEVPAGATLGDCRKKLYRTQKDPAPGAQKVCGTPYTIDAGSGYGKVVQDCEYQVYADWCQYTVREWRQIDEAILRGSGPNPSWPVVRLGSNQREGPRNESYEITLQAEDQEYTFRTTDAALFARCQIGSRWTIQVRGSRVQSIMPAE